MTTKHLIFLWLVVSAAQGCTLLETSSESYSTRSEIVEKGAFERGWIPEWIPSTATDIRLVKDIEVNTYILRFNFAHWDRSELLKNCAPATRSTVKMPRMAFVRQTWWWKMPNSADFYVCDSRKQWLAIDSGWALIWNN